MKILATFLFTLFFAFTFFAQNKRSSYLQLNFSTPLRGTWDSDDDSDYLFLPDGLNVKFGGGLHYNKRLAIGINTGIDWIATEKLVVVPVFGNLKLSTKIDPEMFLFLQGGYGKSIAIGRGSLTGDYTKIGLGLEDIEGLGLFTEFTQYGFSLYSPEKIWSISFGISFTYFTKPIRNPTPASVP